MTDVSHNCEQIIPLLDSYHDGESSPDEKVTIESHLAECPVCRQRLSSIGSLVATLKMLPEMSTTVDFADRVEQLILSRENSGAINTAGGVNKAGSLSNSNSDENGFSAGKVVRFGRAAWAAAAAAVLVLSLLVTQFFLHHPALDVASNNTAGTDTRLNSNDKAVTASAENSQASPRKEQSGSDESGKTESAKAEKNKVNEQTIPASKMAGRRIRVADAGASQRQGAGSALSADRNRDALAAAIGNSSVEGDNQKQSLVAFSEPESSNIAEEIGITTDEDGLYAIKL